MLGLCSPGRYYHCTRGIPGHIIALYLPDSFPSLSKNQRMSLDSLGMSLDSLGMNLDSLGMSLDSLGMSLDSLGMSLDSLGMSLDSPGMSLDSPGVMRLGSIGLQVFYIWFLVLLPVPATRLYS